MPRTFMKGRTGKPKQDEYIPYIESAEHIDDAAKRILIAFLEYCGANKIKYLWHGERFNWELFVSDKKIGYIAFGIERRIDNDFIWSLMLNHREFLPLDEINNNSELTEFFNAHLNFCKNCDGNKCAVRCGGKLRFDDPSAETMVNVYKLIDALLIFYSNIVVIKGPITEDTIIGSRKITLAQFDKFFKAALGEDYIKYPLAWDASRMPSRHKGKSLKEIVTECINNPSGNKHETDITNLQYQKKHKPKIEDVLRVVLDGDELKPALDFIAYLRETKTSPSWSGVHNAWDASSKGKLLCKIWVRKTKGWGVSLYFNSFNQYEEQLKGTEFEKFIWEHLSYCSCPDGHCDAFFQKRYKTLFGKTIDNFGCMPLIGAANLDAAGVEQFIKLLEMEKRART